MHDKNKYIIHMKNSRQALNHELLFKKAHRVKFNQKVWLKPYIKTNVELRKNQKMSWKKIYSS